MMQILEQEVRILTHDADAFGLWRPDAAFRLMQEIAGAHSAQLGFARPQLLKQCNSIWMLARTQLEVRRYPKLWDKLHATTWYGPAGRITYPRYVLIADEAGVEIAVFATSWVVVDVETRRIRKSDSVNLAFPPVAALAPPIPEPGRIHMVKAGELTRIKRAPQYSDLDVNGHMNNASYVSWIMDLFPIQWHQAHRVKRICINYSAEARPGELVSLELYRNGLLFELVGMDEADQHTVFEAQGEWMKVRE